LVVMTQLGKVDGGYLYDQHSPAPLSSAASPRGTVQSQSLVPGGGTQSLAGKWVGFQIPTTGEKAYKSSASLWYQVCGMHPLFVILKITSIL
jgi:hypothetical protein